MLRRTIVALLAGGAVVLTAPAMADRPTGGIWEKTPRIKRKPKVKQEEASATAHNAMAVGGYASAPLPGLTTGLAVKTSTGALIGTVSQVVTASDGSLQMVMVTGVDGRSYSLLPSQLSIENGVVITH